MKISILAAIISATLNSVSAHGMPSNSCYQINESEQNVSALELCVEFAQSRTDRGWHVAKIIFKKYGTEEFVANLSGKVFVADAISKNNSFNKFILMDAKPTSGLIGSLNQFLVSKVNPIEFQGRIDAATKMERGMVTMGIERFEYHRQLDVNEGGEILLGGKVSEAQ